MGAVFTTRMLVIAAASVTIIAAVDAAIGGNWDLTVVAAMALALQVAALARLGRRRHQVRLRADLALWLENRAAVTGESSETIVDRALMLFASGLDPTGGR